MKNIKQFKLVFNSQEKPSYKAINGNIEDVERGDMGDIITLSSDFCKGANQCVVNVLLGEKAFSFLADGVSKKAPVFCSHLGVAVTETSDPRSFLQIKEDILSLNAKTQTQSIEEEEEFSLEEAYKLPHRKCPTFLASPGNVNIWEMGFRGFPIEEKQHFDLYDYIVPRKNWDRIDFGEDAQRVVYRYMIGRGMAYASDFVRSNLKGYLPILNANLQENGISYQVTAFADSMEGKLEDEKGTHYLAADLRSAGHVLSDEQQKIAKEKDEQSPNTLLRVRFTAENTQKTSKIAYFRFPHINTPVMAEANKIDQTLSCGVGYYKDKVYMLIDSEDGAPSAYECAFVLAPEQKITFDAILFGFPVEKTQISQFSAKDFSKKLDENAKYWENRMGSVKDWHLPEKEVDEAFKTGVIHLIQNCFGEKDSDCFAPTAGVYSPIGSESSPIIRLFDSIGLNDFAGKCLNFFLFKQREDGFIQNQTGYMLENGATLYTAYEHFALSKDEEWVKFNKQRIVKAADYIVRWIDDNRTEKNGGFGMIDGQVADPVDTFRSFALNAIAYAGLSGTGKMFSAIGMVEGEKYSEIAAELKSNVQKAFRECLKKCPLVPLGNGEWVPAVAPWAEGRGATSLHLEGEIAVTHASHILKDSLLSLPFLVFYGIFDYDSDEAKLINDYISDNFLEQKVGYSQPYYSLIPFIDLRVGNKKSFLREYYTAFATISDRQTYSFWEHYFLATPHKTHEQSWFLMQTINMLYYSEGDNLNLLFGAPNSWFEEGKSIVVKDAKCEFGKFSLSVKTDEDGTKITFDSDFKDKNIYVKLPDRVVKVCQ